jgi:hypothetical protein
LRVLWSKTKVLAYIIRTRVVEGRCKSHLRKLVPQSAGHPFIQICGVGSCVSICGEKKICSAEKGKQSQFSRRVMKKIFRHLVVMMGVGLWFILGGGSSHSQNLPPVFDPVGTCYVNEGDTLNINLFATDPDGDILKIWVLGSPPNVVFSDDGEGYANFCWVPEFIGPQSSSGSPFELFFVASDGSLATQMEVKVNVINVNRPPELILPDSFSIGANTELVFQVRAEDKDKEEVRIRAVDLPGGAGLDEEGIFSWTPELADTGAHTPVFEAIDLSGGNDLKEAHIRVIPPSPYVLSIGMVEVLVGGEVRVPINLNNPDTVSGMELLIQYDPTTYTFLGLTKDGTRVSEWEYYVCRERSEGLFELIKIVGIADFPNELSTLPLLPGDGPIAYLNFKMTSNTQYAGLLIPLEFYYFDFTDNTLSNFGGEFIPRDKINFTNGGVLLEAGKTLLGDINLNGIPFDVGDPVVLARHLVYGTPLNQQQLLNSDVNQDGYWATLADLMYMIMRIQEGGSPPYVEPDPQTEVAKAKVTISDQPAMTSFSLGSETEMGGLLFVFKETNIDSGAIKLSPEIQDMDIYTYQDADELKVMIISTEGKCIHAGERCLFTIEGEGALDSVEISISDSEGNLVGVKTIYEQRSTLPRAYSLSQNYPNPFNPVTSIQYAVGSKQTKAADGGLWTADNSTQHVTLKVYNILGQLVRILVDEEKLPGTYQVVWDGKDQNKEEVSSGIYFYRLKASDYVEAKKMILLK